MHHRGRIRPECLVEIRPEYAFYVIFANGLDDDRAKTACLNADGKIIDLGLGCGVPTMPLSSDHYSPIVPPVAK